ncbi:efflux RND transporter periplasmic adaptor subunit [Pararhizobium mangrovi]|uniref:Efflux RND transporter periplasmic adaptor subunit n=1 Tax=Pararhizobium mangrovi TaxID=2590452 RepID=A0A506U1B0_9HYPH|nr:efflux RND transporter periplasmic adaptor subunit [Pararhizobium mangrovi]TPW28143.1 efflux RND transporter periplasmic adaptor subunit [Pararhizobium mangrovi]
MIFKTIVRFLVTAVVVVVAGLVVWNLWIYYEEEPRTRDARVSADVVAIAPDVAGHVVNVAVSDDATVKKGQTLFKLDPARYSIAVDQAKAALKTAKATLDQARRDADRFDKLGDNVASIQQHEQAATDETKAEAAYEQAKAALDLAELNLHRTTVHSPVNGRVTNLSLKTGDYVTAGKPSMAVVDADSFYVMGYFEETKLAKIDVGDPATITMMGDDTVLKGHVAGVSAAITDSNRTTNADLLPNVDPSFTWVRLAQRIPVRIALDDAPKDGRLVAGRTASVDITPSAKDGAVTATSDRK